MKRTIEKPNEIVNAHISKTCCHLYVVLMKHDRMTHWWYLHDSSEGRRGGGGEESYYKSQLHPVGIQAQSRSFALSRIIYTKPGIHLCGHLHVRSWNLRPCENFILTIEIAFVRSCSSLSTVWIDKDFFKFSPISWWKVAFVICKILSDPKVLCVKLHMIRAYTNISYTHLQYTRERCIGAPFKKQWDHFLNTFPFYSLLFLFFSRKSFPFNQSLLPSIWLFNCIL